MIYNLHNRLDISSFFNYLFYEFYINSFAAICQANGLVPIVEPEVLCDGKFSIEMVEKTTEKVLSSVFKALQDHNVMLEGIILKPNMVRSGSDAPVQAWPTDIGAATLRVMKRTVPSAVKGIAFLSGGTNFMNQ